VHPLTTLSLNNQLQNQYLQGEQGESNEFVVSLALAISLALHFTIMQALPWLEAVTIKPPATIIAELQTLPPPPPPTEAKPIEPPTQPEIVKPDKPAPTPTLKSQAVAQPLLAAKQEAEPIAEDYKVADVPQPATVPSEPTAPAAPETSSAPSESATSSSKNVTTSSSSTSTWDDSDVWDEFGRNLQGLVERHKKYPEIARRRGWQGLAKVLVRFSSEGKTLSVAIEKSTGQKVLDEQALEMVRKSLNDLPVPNKFKGREFKLTIPVDFKLE
jgi:protein TonB